MAIKQENRQHALAAEKALKAVYVNADEDAIADMLSDLRHLCDAQGRDFAKIDRRAYRNYSGEGGATITTAPKTWPLTSSATCCISSVPTATSRR